MATTINEITERATSGEIAKASLMNTVIDAVNDLNTNQITLISLTGEHTKQIKELYDRTEWK